MTAERGESSLVHLAAWGIIRSFGAERGTRAETAAIVQALERMGAFAPSERDTLREAGWLR